MHTGWWEIDIHGCYALVKITFVLHARTINEYDVTMPVPWVQLTSQINCGDVTMLSQKRPLLGTIVNWVIDDLYLVELCVQDIEYHVRNKMIQSFSWRMIFWSLMIWFANHLTHDQKIIIHSDSCIILYFTHVPADADGALWPNSNNEQKLSNFVHPWAKVLGLFLRVQFVASYFHLNE